jgi:hypothetical protein
MIHFSDSHNSFSPIAANNLGGGTGRGVSCASWSPLPVLPPTVSPSATPLSNTGLLSQDLHIGVDYLTISTAIADAADIHKHISTLSIIFQDAYELHFDQGRFIGKQYSGWAQSPSGGMISWNLPGENKQDPHFGDIRIALSGEVLKRAQQIDIIRYLRIQMQHGAKCSRIDLRADDYTRVMLPEYMLEACRAGNHSGFKNSNIHAETTGDIYESGWTLYLGSRQSDRFARYYNAFPVHQVECFRFEIELKHDVADQTAHYLCIGFDDEDMLATIMGAFIAGQLSFIDRSGGIRPSRCSKLAWWQAFTDRLGSSIRLSPPKITRTIQKSMDWIEHKVSGTLAMVLKYINPTDKISYIKRLIQLGETKFSARHETILKASAMEHSKHYSIQDDVFVYSQKIYEYDDDLCLDF